MDDKQENDYGVDGSDEVKTKTKLVLMMMTSSVMKMMTKMVIGCRPRWSG